MAQRITDDTHNFTADMADLWFSSLGSVMGLGFSVFGTTIFLGFTISLNWFLVSGMPSDNNLQACLGCLQLQFEAPYVVQVLWTCVLSLGTLALTKWLSVPVVPATYAWRIKEGGEGD